MLLIVTSTAFGQEQSNRKSQDHFYLSLAKFDLGWYGGRPETKWFNQAISIGAMHDKPLGKGPFSVALGLGFSTYNYHSNLRVADGDLVAYHIPIWETDSTWHGYSSTLKPNEFVKNKISWTYIDIPFEFRIRTKPNNKNNYFKISLGAKLSVLLQTHSKLKTKEYTEKYVNFSPSNKWDIGPTIGIGYGRWSLQMALGFRPVLYTANGSTFEWDSEAPANKLTTGIVYHISK